MASNPFADSATAASYEAWYQTTGRRADRLEKALLGRLLAAAISTPLGALVSYPFINEITKPILGLLLAVSGGSLVYVGASHLLPEVEKEYRRYSIISMAVGVLVAVVVVLSKR